MNSILAEKAVIDQYLVDGLSSKTLAKNADAGIDQYLADGLIQHFTSPYSQSNVRHLQERWKRPHHH